MRFYKSLVTLSFLALTVTQTSSRRLGEEGDYVEYGADDDYSHSGSVDYTEAPTPSPIFSWEYDGYYGHGTFDLTKKMASFIYEGWLGDTDFAFNYCFSSHASVEVEGKGKLSMSDLKVGDKVLTGKGKFEPVYTINHRHPTKEAPFLQIYTTTEEEPLELTENHMLFLKGNSNPVPAAKVQVGDEVKTLQGHQTVKKISTITRKGIFNPLTTDGTIVVNGIISSSYAAYLSDNDWIQIAGFKIISQQSFFDKILKPYRYMCTGVSFELCKTRNELDVYSQLGWDIYQYSMKKSEIFQAISLISFVTLALVFDLVFSPYILLFGALLCYYSLRNPHASKMKTS